jgi:hypothetical protein
MPPSRAPSTRRRLKTVLTSKCDAITQSVTKQLFPPTVETTEMIPNERKLFTIGDEEDETWNDATSVSGTFVVEGVDSPNEDIPRRADIINNVHTRKSVVHSPNAVVRFLGKMCGCKNGVKE